jgi:hypothetical protein
MADRFFLLRKPKNMPADWRDTMLYNEAVRINEDKTMPAAFPQDSLDYLWELGYTLPRRGIFFIGSADDFISKLVIATLAEPIARIVQVIRKLDQQKWDAASDGNFEAARDFLFQRKTLQAEAVKLPIHQITRDEIRAALLHEGIDPDAPSNQSG